MTAWWEGFALGLSIPLVALALLAGVATWRRRRKARLRRLEDDIVGMMARRWSEDLAERFDVVAVRVPFEVAELDGAPND